MTNIKSDERRENKHIIMNNFKYTKETIYNHRLSFNFRLSVLLKIFFSFGFLLGNLSAQSIFSFREEGESILMGDAHMSALGYGEIPGTISSNLCGSIAFLKKTGISVTYNGTRLEMGDKGGKNIKYYYGFPYIKVASTLPLDLTFGFSVRKAMDFNANFITNPDSVNGISYQERFLKKGQLSVGNVEIAKRIGKIAGVGFGLNVLFGSSDEVWLTNFSDTLYKDTKDSLNSYYFGYSYALGFVLDLHPLSFVFGYSLPISCKKETRSLSYFRKDTTLGTYELVYPSLYSLGGNLSVRKDLDILITARYRDWSNFKYDGAKEEDFLDVLSYSIGLEYKRIRGYKEKEFPLRVGYFSKPWYFKDSYNQRISDNGITFGTSIPVLKKGGYLDVAFALGRRKTVELEERFYSLQVGFNFYERW